MSIISSTPVLAGAFYLAAGMVCSWKIIRKQGVDPPLSTWLIFIAATIIGFATYLKNGGINRPLTEGALPLSDVVMCAIVALTLVFFGSRGLAFKPFERVYVVGLVLILVYWYFTSDPWWSNILVQGLIMVGFIPTIQNMFREGRNTESFLFWLLVLVGSAIACYPAYRAWVEHGSSLVLIYSARATIACSSLLALMTFFTLRGRWRLAGDWS